MQLKQDQSKKKLKVAVGSAVALLVIALVGGGFTVMRTAQEREKQAALRLEAEMREKKAGEEAERARKEADENLKRLMGEIDKLKGDLENASDAEKEAIQAELDKKLATAGKRPNSSTGGSKPSSGGASKPAKPSKPKPACDCPPGDPLCSCF
jgi:colicin import membrane protein